MRRAERHPIVSGNTPSPLFWFTTWALFTERKEVEKYGRVQPAPLFLLKPEIVFNKIWLRQRIEVRRGPSDFKSLLD